MEGPLLPHQAAQHQNSGNVLGGDGGQSHTRHAHIHQDHEDQVQHHIDHASSGEVVQGPLCIPLRPEDGRAKVIKYVGGHAQEVNTQVKGRQINDVSRRRHPHQQLPGHDSSKNHQGHAADQRQGDRSVNAAAHVVFPPRAQIPGHHHVGAHRQADEQVDEQVDQRGV